MSDDSFIREVDEELRQDRLKALWKQYGAWIIGAAVAILLVTAASILYQNWIEGKANSAGDAFLQALNLAEEGRHEEALSALEALEAQGYGAYPVLAQMRAATLQAEQGNVDDAVAAFDAVAADTSASDVLRDVARLRAAYLLVDHGDRDAVASRVEPLTGDAHPMRHSAREALGLAAWKSGDLEDAARLFGQIIADAAAPASLRERSNVMVELIGGAGSPE